MRKQRLLTSLTITAALTLAACSDSDDTEPSASSEFNPNGEQNVDDGKGGGDTTAISGLWDGTITEGETSDVVYWGITDDGVLTRYDYQQDGVTSASGENCYIIGDPVSVSPEDGNDYSFFNVAVTAVKADDTLTVTFIDADANDLDEDGDTAETPTFTWPALTTPLVEDLNNCTTTADEATQTTDGESDSTTDADQSTSTEEGGEETEGELPPTSVPVDEPGASDGGDAGGIPFDNSEGRPLMTRAECANAGGKVIGDIGNGAIHKPEYRCESGEPPIARITYLEGEPIATEGEVCCL